MKLNTLEFMLMNNPVRAAIQAHFETPALFGAHHPLTGLRVMEIGCGRGVGIELLLSLGAGHVIGFDFDPRMVALARERLTNHATCTAIYVGDAEHISAPDNAFDAVVDYGILHHVPRWEFGLHEIARVLKSGGVFYFEDILKGFTAARLAQIVFDHPQVSQFSGGEFKAGIEVAGLQVVKWRQVGEIGVIGQARKCGMGDIRHGGRNGHPNAVWHAATHQAIAPA